MEKGAHGKLEKQGTWTWNQIEKYSSVKVWNIESFRCNLEHLVSFLQKLTSVKGADKKRRSTAMVAHLAVFWRHKYPVLSSTSVFCALDRQFRCLSICASLCQICASNRKISRTAVTIHTSRIPYNTNLMVLAWFSASASSCIPVIAIHSFWRGQVITVSISNQ